MTCEDEKNIDEQLQHYRECDKCFLMFKKTVFDVLNTPSGKMIVSIVKKLIPKNIIKDTNEKK